MLYKGVRKCRQLKERNKRDKSRPTRSEGVVETWSWRIQGLQPNYTQSLETGVYTLSEDNKQIEGTK